MYGNVSEWCSDQYTLLGLKQAYTVYYLKVCGTVFFCAAGPCQPVMA
jgi:formylglycine-generating enzyme required for sulfatase activity